MKKHLLLFLFPVLSWPILTAAQNGTTYVETMSEIDCSRCHTCENPTSEDPCLILCPRMETVHQTTPHRVEEGPDSIVLDRIAELYRPVTFNHKVHADMSKMGGDCATCHHYSPPGHIPPCGDCHDAEKTETNLRMPSLKGAYHRQCLGCHREWSHDTKCIVCHLPQEGTAMATEIDSTDILGIPHPIITEPDVKVYRTPHESAPVVTFFHKEHIELFGLRCVDCHRQESCDRCHDIERSVKVTSQSPEEVHAICNDCHRTDECTKCHDVKKRPPFTHASTGWPLNEYHNDLDCRACHPTGKRIARLDSDCGTCHGGWNQENFRHAVTGLRLDKLHAQLDCEDCHTGRQYSATPACDDCHDDGRTGEDQPPGERVSLNVNQ